MVGPAQKSFPSGLTERFTAEFLMTNGLRGAITLAGIRLMTERPAAACLTDNSAQRSDSATGSWNNDEKDS